MNHTALANKCIFLWNLQNSPGVLVECILYYWHLKLSFILIQKKKLFKEEAVEPMTPAIPACLASLLHSGIWSSFSFLATSKPPFSRHAEGFRHQEHSSTNITVYGAISKCFTLCLWWIFIYKRLHSAGFTAPKNLSEHTRITQGPGLGSVHNLRLQLCISSCCKSWLHGKSKTSKADCSVALLKTD